MTLADTSLLHQSISLVACCYLSDRVVTSASLDRPIKYGLRCAGGDVKSPLCADPPITEEVTP